MIQFPISRLNAFEFGSLGWFKQWNYDCLLMSETLGDKKNGKKIKGKLKLFTKSEHIKH